MEPGTESERASRLETLHRQAERLDQPERSAFLDACCAGDPGLRAELEARLRDEVETRAATRHEASPDTVDVRDGTLPAGTVLGAWRITRPVGRGGMGEVYEARRADGAFELKVAIKLLKRGLDTEAVVARFNRERRLLAQLAHPNIAHVLDAGVAPDGRPFLAMEYVDGQPISAYVGSAALEPRARLRLMITVCEAVQAAHAQRIVHRDLKPSNVLVTGEGQVKLLDFGIAKALSEEDADATHMAGEALAYTPTYAAPEQFLGLAASPATDVYALGVILYQLITDRLPHARSGRSSSEIARALAKESVERPSTVLRRERGRLKDSERIARLKATTSDLDLIVLKALQAAPERRYATAQELADDLQRLLDNRPIVARPDSMAYRAARFVRRNRVPVLAVSAVILALSIGLVTALLARSEATHRRQQADELVNFMLGDLKETLTQVGRLDAMDATMAKAEAYVGSVDAHTRDADLLAQAVRTYTAISEAGVQRGRFPEAGAAGQKAVDLARELKRRQPNNESDALLASSIYALTDTQSDFRRLDQTLALLGEGLQIGRGLVAKAPDNPAYRLVNAQFADQLGYFVNAGRSDLAGASALDAECLRVLEPLITRDDLGSRYLRFHLQCRHNRLYYLERLDEIKPATDEVREGLRRFPGDLAISQQALQIYRNSTRLLSTYGDPAAALAVAHDGLALGRKLRAIEANSSEYAWPFASLLTWTANAERAMGDYAAARRDADESLQSLADLQHRAPDFVNIRYELARLRRVRARIAMADGRGSAAALTETQAGLALITGHEGSLEVVRNVLAACLFQWLYALDSQMGLVPEARREAHRLIDLLQAQHDATPAAREWEAGVKYLEGTIDAGDQIYLQEHSASGLPMSSDLREIRDAMCRRRQRSGAPACLPLLQ